ncbi:MAG: NAD(+)/NADH kinase [Elusimicrobiales bacterium]|nr:NAD(+)/NADH kinase [Elusimicrobiales bacterium]
MKCTIFYNSSNVQNIKILRFLEKILCENFISFEKICVIKKFCGDIKSDFAISIGGDGTVLWASHFLVEKEIPLIAVKAGGLGFLSSVEVSELKDFIKSYIKGKYKVVNRTVLEIKNGKDKFIALNDCVIKSSSFRMFYCDVFYSKEFISSYFSDGVIISTPTGSTAYNLSAMGPIVHPNSKVILLTPISSHTLTHRSLVLPETSLLKIKVRNKKGDKSKIFILIDGQKNIQFGEELLVSVYKKTFKTIVSKDYSYFDILRKKLSWGERDSF